MLVSFVEYNKSYKRGLLRKKGIHKLARKFVAQKVEVLIHFKSFPEKIIFISILNDFNQKFRVLGTRFYTPVR